MINFACLSPHAPIFLPNIGSPSDREKVKKTISSLEILAPKLAEANPELIIVSSPHPDWGFNVPLHFLAQNLHGIEIKTELTDFQSPKAHFQKGKDLITRLTYVDRLAWIASGDMSHRLREDGPYGLHPSGPKFDKKFIELLKKKDIEGILNLDPALVEEAGECGLRSFCMLLGALDWQSRSAWQAEILSYESPFGVGYLVTNFNINAND